MLGFLVLALVGGMAALLIRPSARTDTVVFLLIGTFIPLSMALAAWVIGSPPIWTLFAQRNSAVIQVADIVPPIEGQAERRSDLVDVRVRLQGDRSARVLQLFGVEPPRGSFSGREEAQRALRSDFPIGGTLTVRVGTDVAYLDKQDWFATALFLFCIVFMALMLLISFVVVKARSGSRVRPPPV